MNKLTSGSTSRRERLTRNLRVVLGLELGVEHVAEQRLWSLSFVLLILQPHAVVFIVGVDVAPRVEQVDDAVLDAPQALIELLGFDCTAARATGP